MTDEERQLLMETKLSDSEENWTYIGAAGTVVILLVWAWLMVVFLSAVFG